MQTKQENELQIKNDIGTAGYARTVGEDGKSYRTGISALVSGAIGGDIEQLENDVEALQTTVGEHTADIQNNSDDISDLQTLTSGHTTSIGNLQTAVGTNTTAIGTLANLTTTEKSNLVGAINEVNEDVSDVKKDLADFESIGETRNLFDPIYKSETVGGVTYAYSNGTMVMSGTASGRIAMQTITGTVGDKFSLSCFDVSGGKPTFYVMNGSTVVATYRQSDMNCTFTLPTTTVTLEYYVSGTFSYSFGLTLVKDEVPSYPLLINADGQQNILNFANVTYEAIGDSLTYGFTGSWTEGVQNRINTPYPEKVGELLGVKNVLNKGETGTTIANDIEKMGTYYPISNDNRLSGYSYAQIISIMGGTNDFEKGTALGTVYDSTSDTTFHAGWKRIFSNLLGRFSTYDAFIFVIVPPVTRSKYSDNSAGVKWIDYINATLEECRNFGVPVLDMSTMGRLCPTNKSLYTSDGIHFNQKYVSRIFAHMVADFIKRNCH